MTTESIRPSALFLNLDGTNAKEIGVPKEAKVGRAQLIVEEVTQRPGNEAKNFSVKARVLAHDDQSSVDRYVFDNFQLQGAGVGRTAELLCEVGLIQKQTLVDSQGAEGQGGGKGFNPQDLLGRVYFSELKLNEYNGKTSIKPSWAVYGEGNPAIVEKKFPYAKNRVPRAVLQNTNSANSGANLAVAEAAARVANQASSDDIPF